MRLLLVLAAAIAVPALAAGETTPPPAPAAAPTSAPAPAKAAASAGPSGEITVTGPAKPGDNRDPNKIVCKGDVETGSLVRKKKRCLTRAQWAEEERDARRNFDDAQRRELIRQQMLLPKPGPVG